MACGYRSFLRTNEDVLDLADNQVPCDHCTTTLFNGPYEELNPYTSQDVITCHGNAFSCFQLVYFLCLPNFPMSKPFHKPNFFSLLLVPNFSEGSLFLSCHTWAKKILCFIVNSFFGYEIA